MTEFVRTTTTNLFRGATGTAKLTKLLWGDQVEVEDRTGARWRVRARGRRGFVDPDDLGGESLLELYFIDVGQGDGVLIRTPDGRHVMIDGGWPRRKQPTGRNAADFVDWKFVEDYRRDTIHLDAMICSHNDQDHYGGLWDLLDVSQSDELDADAVTVDRFYHAGLSWWTFQGQRSLGPFVDTTDGAMFTHLLEDRASIAAGLDPQAAIPLQGEWADFLGVLTQARTANGAPTPVTRLSHVTGFLPGFENAGGASISVLAPVEFEVDGAPAIRRFAAATGKNTNGNSVLLRVDYGSARVLLTGDLNKASQQALLDDYQGQQHVFEADVAKACHHGAEDLSAEFLRRMRPTATIISSGDSEGHDHPRPNAVGASGASGFQRELRDQFENPLIYCTELARSINLAKVMQIEILDAQGQVRETLGADQVEDLRLTYEVTKAGDLHPTQETRRFGDRRLAAGVVYGLVNVRTDGQRILTAVLNEKKASWNVEEFDARF